MQLTDTQIKAFNERLYLSRMRILTKHGFYGLLLMHMHYGLSELAPTAFTDAKGIYFNPDFLDKLSDSELDFVMLHEIMHVVLKHCFRANNDDSWRSNIAADIVVNSTILNENGMDLSTIMVMGEESMHLTPSGEEGYNFTVEEVYEMLGSSSNKDGDDDNSGVPADGTPDRKSDDMSDGNPSDGKSEQKPTDGNTGEVNQDADGDSDNLNSGMIKGGRIDDHSHWHDNKLSDEYLEDLWNKRIRNACESIKIREAGTGRSLLPLSAQRILGELTKPQTDWRSVLDTFVQEDIVDYSFNPPDRRFDGSDFYLPDYNVPDEIVKDVLFMIDTSGSVSDKMMTAAYSEIIGAIDQFEGEIRGWLGFFDATVYDPVPFSDEDELHEIKPKGGGGTDFYRVFNYVEGKMVDNPPSSIVILTDGFAQYPPEEMAMDIPVLWLLTDDRNPPPWGNVAYLDV